MKPIIASLVALFLVTGCMEEASEETNVLAGDTLSPDPVQAAYRLHDLMDDLSADGVVSGNDVVEIFDFAAHHSDWGNPYANPDFVYFSKNYETPTLQQFFVDSYDDEGLTFGPYAVRKYAILWTFYSKVENVSVNHGRLKQPLLYQGVAVSGTLHEHPFCGEPTLYDYFGVSKYQDLTHFTDEQLVTFAEINPNGEQLKRMSTLRTMLWNDILMYRVEAEQPYLAETQGIWLHGTITDPCTGIDYDVVHWADVDDSSYSAYYDRFTGEFIYLQYEN